MRTLALHRCGRSAQVMKKKGDAQQQVLMTAAEAKQRLNDALAQKVLGGVVAVDSPQNGLEMDGKMEVGTAYRRPCANRP